METALGTVEYLKKEREYIVWEAASDELSYVNSMLERTPLYGKFSVNFLETSCRPGLKLSKLIQTIKIAVTTRSLQHLYDYRSQAHSVTIHYESLLGCVGRNASFVGTAASTTINQIMNKYMVEMVGEIFNETGLDNTGAKHLESIDASLRYTVYCTGIKYGGVEEWDFAFNQYKTSNVASEKSRLMSALACRYEQRYLRYALTPDQIRKQDATSVLVYISRNSVGRSLTWDFIRANWDYIFNEYRPSLYRLAKLVDGITKKFNSKYENDQKRHLLRFDKNENDQFCVCDLRKLILKVIPFCLTEPIYGTGFFSFTRLIGGITESFNTNLDVSQILFRISKITLLEHLYFHKEKLMRFFIHRPTTLYSSNLC
ncbi:hypothetical protein KUTeg_002846 [Tegillarca granosa]|uniref:ERAP1-like C-terminal domain-containing protein n=1 Tax=Tegillarca granosa TaxID=220873 RepID=A0ABQ9FUD8_TEGGR|nr:hypothetical protein KUTeg_002846 [Tegillarca granosa]